jgi:hypothetical protein
MAFEKKRPTKRRARSLIGGEKPKATRDGQGRSLWARRSSRGCRSHVGLTIGSQEKHWYWGGPTEDNALRGSGQTQVLGERKGSPHTDWSQSSGADNGSEERVARSCFVTCQ